MSTLAHEPSPASSEVPSSSFPRGFTPDLWNLLHQLRAYIRSSRASFASTVQALRSDLQMLSPSTRALLSKQLDKVVLARQKRLNGIQASITKLRDSGDELPTKELGLRITHLLLEFSISSSPFPSPPFKQEVASACLQ
jgi:hypothetical protein